MLYLWIVMQQSSSDTKIANNAESHLLLPTMLHFRIFLMPTEMLWRNILNHLTTIGVCMRSVHCPLFLDLSIPSYLLVISHSPFRDQKRIFQKWEFSFESHFPLLRCHVGNPGNLSNGPNERNGEWEMGSGMLEIVKVWYFRVRSGPSKSGKWVSNKDSCF